MAAPTLLLYTRLGCCLCEGLQERLLTLDPPPVLEVLDVDTDPALQQRYGLEVPVLALKLADGGLRELPRVSPRLSGGGLADWLRRNGFSGGSV
ncbi:glutaredoxin family protein [Vulcanococcus limneticus Candia 3F8]|uniref:glutaredoxin family protein n=1 Tax=Vulcanococcus limneticus TaxID=2170428 RepID=UPI000B993528|nr:glutaredoxin family protein [Vulcanococcus limneticus]MCP9790858.1 glutaredoxin family protein [Vulcanococcus limneticus MW73D5]MCP9892799.1 glutaredoxin family protein [Vulcanococcus limneticus Candia 3F8]MCP9896465.1 glutaredoxin family protein [Vulcanococcus limneticus Candia 3B3]